MSYYPTFRDGKRTINFILVYKTSAIVKESENTKHKTFLEGLERLGLELEEEHFSVDEDVVFIKLHAPDGIILSYGGLFDIDIVCHSFTYRPFVKPPPSYLATPLTNPNVNDPIYARAPESMSGEIPKKITSAEKIMVVYQILTRCIWGEGRGDYGIHKLIKAKIFIDAFPLHDGDYKWTSSGPLNDRQLLALYWGSSKCWRKAQPLNLVETYFGTEYALYFAWLGMYIKFLIPAAALSLLVLIYGIITSFTYLNNRSREICESDIIMCPRCHFAKCPKEFLSNSCVMAKITYLFDNWCAVVFSAVMSLWGTVFMEMWQREESVLQLQWNLRSLEHTISVRPEFIERATKTRYSPITGKMEPYIPKKQTLYRYTVTLVSVAFLLIIMCLATFGVMVYRVTVNTMLAQRRKNDIITKKLYRGLIASLTGGLMSGFFIFIFKYFYEKLALSLTNLENHRTWSAYSNAYIYKSFALAFTNNYSAVFYIAFFKGKFFTYPGDLHLLSYLGGLNTDVCDPTGCIVDLAMLLIIIMILKAFVSNVAQVISPKIKKMIKSILFKARTEDTPQWEKEYVLAEAEEFFIVEEYMEMVIQYGFVNFFIMGFPLAPLLALLNNIAELRVDASKVTKSYRRPIPTRVVGLGAWFGILQAMTYVGVVTNALVIAFTSTFMEKAIYRTLRGDEKHGFLNYTLSMFDMNEFKMLDSRSNVNYSGICYYHGQRYPPDHKLKYQRRKDYWHHLGIKFAAVVIFEHVVILIKGLLAYAIPDVPFSVKQQLVFQEKTNKKKKMTEKNEAYLKKREKLQKELEERRLRETKEEQKGIEKETKK